MQSTMIVCSYNRPMQEGTRAVFQRLTRSGAAYVSQTGSADVALARNIALTGALRSIRSIASRAGTWVILMVDDDMTFTEEQAQVVVDEARRTGVACAAMYATTKGTLAASRLAPVPGQRQRWLAGLGLLAIPLPLLLDVEARSTVFELDDGPHTEFTWSACDDGKWYSEDYLLCRRLGGVYLLPVGVGHLKTVPLYPDQQTIDAIRDERYDLLAGEPDPCVLHNLAHPSMRVNAPPKADRVAEGTGAA